jgi:hypothetical protein
MELKIESVEDRFSKFSDGIIDFFKTNFKGLALTCFISGAVLTYNGFHNIQQNLSYSNHQIFQIKDHYNLSEKLESTVIEAGRNWPGYLVSGLSGAVIQALGRRYFYRKRKN